MSRWYWLIGFLTINLGLVLAGCPNCPYESRCKGNTLHTCWLGPDQFFGSPCEDAHECQSPNPTCVNISERDALCVMDQNAPCDESLKPFCENNMVISCVSDFLVAEDCPVHGNTCFSTDETSRCALAPLTACDPYEFTSTCNRSSIIRCNDGFVQAEDCANRETPSSCQEFENQYGRGAYCT